MSIEIWVNQDKKTISILNVAGETESYIHTTDELVMNERTMKYYQIVRPHMKWLVSKTTKRFDKTLLDSDQDIRNEFMDTLRDTFGLSLAGKDEINAIAFPVENTDYDNPQYVFSGHQAIIEKTMYKEDKRILVYTNEGIYTDTVPIKTANTIITSLNNTYAVGFDKIAFRVVEIYEDAIFSWLNEETSTVFSKGKIEKLNRVVETIPTFTFIDNEKYSYEEIEINDGYNVRAVYNDGYYKRETAQLHDANNQWLFDALEEK